MSQTYIIAEAGVNHNGSQQTALELVRTAKKAGADAVKFQTFRADALVSASAKKADYQKATTTGEDSQYAMLKRLELSEAAHQELRQECKKLGIDFLSTPFDSGSLSFLVDTLNMSRIKISSGDLTNGPLLLAAARTGLPIILSSGMATLGEIEEALGVLAFGYQGAESAPSVEAFRQAYFADRTLGLLRSKVTLLHCTTEYPAPFEEVNLQVMSTLRNAFGLSTGYSDHTEGIAVSVAAVALGATVIEKHFTLDRNLPGPDHRASIEPQELIDMVRSIRQVERAVGTAQKIPTASEVNNIRAARRSLCVTRPVSQGEKLTAEILTVKRPGMGISPMRYWEFLDREAPRDFSPNEPMDFA